MLTSVHSSAIHQHVYILTNLQVCFVLYQFLSATVQEANVRVTFLYRLSA